MLLTEGMAKPYERMDELNSSKSLKMVRINANYALLKAKPQDDRFTPEFKDNLPNDWLMNKTKFIEAERNRFLLLILF